jgi:outer membrane protein assembly factor BamB
MYAPAPVRPDAGIGAPTPIKVTGSLSALATIPAWDVATAGNRVVVIDDGFLTASAVDATTGKPAWHTQIETVVRGRHTLHPNGATVLEWAGDSIHVLDAASGKISSTSPAAFNGTNWQDGGCGLDISDGVCAQRCQCSFQLLDCATGKPGRKRYEHVYIERIDPRGSRSAGCYGITDNILGRAGQLAIVATEDHQASGTPSGPHIAAAIDLKTGTEAWRAWVSVQATDSGVSPDGKTCWLSTFDNMLRVLDCAQGSELWKSKPVRDPKLHAIAFAPPSGLYVVRDREATLFDARTGKVRWRVTLPANTFGWLPGVQHLDRYDVSAIEVLDPATGKTLASIARPKDTGAISDGGDGFVVAGKEVVRYDVKGTAVARAQFMNGGVQFGDELAVIRTTTTEAIVVERTTLKERGRITGAYDRAFVEGELGKRRIAVFSYDGKKIGRATLLRVDP